jgi:hypothetical protein
MLSEELNVNVKQDVRNFIITYFKDNNIDLLVILFIASLIVLVYLRVLKKEKWRDWDIYVKILEVWAILTLIGTGVYVFRYMKFLVASIN